MKSWAEMANLRSVKVSGCICVRAETRRGLRVRAGSPRPPNPQAQPSLQGMPQIWLSGSLRG